MFIFKSKKKQKATAPAPTTGSPAPATGGSPRPSAEQTMAAGMVSVQDVIAPPAIEVDFDHLKVGTMYFRTLFVSGYPRYVSANWLAPLINFDHSLDVSMFIYPVEGRSILDKLRRKIAEMEAEIKTDLQRGKVVDPATQAKLEDARSLQEELVKGAERFFQFSLYVTIPAESLEELNQVSKQIEATLGSLLIISKHATLQMEDGFKATIPICTDRLMITRNMDTTSLATTFPFTSSELTANEGILYGINEHNDSLIIFDRFTLENANSTVFAKSGAGKSYFVKLETLRSLMFGTEIIIIDPEAEYKTLTEAIDGEYINFGFGSSAKINPFDLSTVYVEGENELNQKILSLHSLFKVIMGQLSPSEEATLDRALVLTYKMKGITPDPGTQKNEPPLMEDLYKALAGMEEKEAKLLAVRIEKFVKGSFRGVFDQHSNIDMNNPFTVFSLRDLEDALRPVAMFIILDYVWTKIRREMKRRILVVDEAWYMMRYPDTANFLRSIAKRARKYYLGLTTITQDVEDFFATDYGKEIVTNSSIQILMKQSPAAIDKLSEVFYLSEGEKHLLLAADVGEGLFFAGANHVAIRVVASPEEHELITSKPEELLQMAERKRRAIEEAKAAEEAKKRRESPAPVITQQ
jgi:type IV secretory pathway VirB4 component